MIARLAIVVLIALPGVARAETLQMPLGGRAVPLGRSRVLCGPIPEGWSLESGGRSIRPPSSESALRSFEARVTSEAGGCAQARDTITLQSTGRFPELDPGGVTYYPDEGRLELQGQRLAGVQVTWQAGDRKGSDRCLTPTGDARRQHCVVPLERGLPLEATLRWLPAGARTGDDGTLFDVTGRPVAADLLELHPSRVLINQLLPTTGAVDISQGIGRIALFHPAAVASVDCGVTRCELGEGGIMVRGVPTLAAQIALQLRLAPRVFMVRGDKAEAQVSATLPVLHCPLTVVSGAPLRDADETQIVVRVDERCGRDARLRWMVGAEPADVVRSSRTSDATFVELRAGRLAGGTVTITAARTDSEGAIVGSVTSKTAPAPRPRAAVELPGYGRIDFIPTNRRAVLLVADPGQQANLIPLPVDGVYTLEREQGKYYIRAEGSAGGFTSLRFGYRAEGLPADFAGSNLAVITEPVQRLVREASVPAPFGAAPGRPEPLVDFRCADRQGETQLLLPGQPARIPFEARDTCRVTLHQERLNAEDGPQEVVLEIEVSRADGTKRNDASVNEHLVLRAGGESRTFWLKAVTAQFDRVVVRVSHVIDESRYVLIPGAKQGLPEVQWSATVEGGRARLYATVAIPAGLYRMNEPSGQLTLNFGVLSRLTWLDRHGKEGLLGLELGLMGIGLIPQSQNGVTVPRTLAAVAGLGIRIELGAGAAVGVHLWGAYEFRDEYQYRLADPVDPHSGLTAPHWAVYFGPSIAIGNAGANL